MTRRATWIRRALVLATVGVTLWLFPGWWCGRDAASYFHGDEAAQLALARAVLAQQREQPAAIVYQSGMARFDGQSAIAIHQMTILGLGQIVREHPHLQGELLPAMRTAGDQLVAPDTHPYAASEYPHHGAVSMHPGEGHAYMGYINLALGMLRAVDPDTPHAALNDRITAHLARELDASPHGMIETYPGETWPPDVAAVAGSIGLHGAATGADHRALLERWAARFAECAIHTSGYLYQRLATGSCRPVDAPRGSGTAVAAYFIHFADEDLARRLYRGVQRTGASTLFRFAAVSEYAPGFSGSGDVNAGPTPFGYSVGATGFALGAARAHGDERLFTTLYRTTHLFGAPYDAGDERRFAVGGRLGNALLLAMLTAGGP